MSDQPIPFEPVPPPPRCLCSHLMALHRINDAGKRANCSRSACGCRVYRDDKAVADV